MPAAGRAAAAGWPSIVADARQLGGRKPTARGRARSASGALRSSSEIVSAAPAAATTTSRPRSPRRPPRPARPSDHEQEALPSSASRTACGPGSAATARARRRERPRRARGRRRLDRRLTHPAASSGRRRRRPPSRSRRRRAARGPVGSIRSWTVECETVPCSPGITTILYARQTGCSSCSLPSSPAERRQQLVVAHVASHGRGVSRFGSTLTDSTRSPACFAVGVRSTVLRLPAITRADVRAPRVEEGHHHPVPALPGERDRLAVLVVQPEVRRRRAARAAARPRYLVASSRCSPSPPQPAATATTTPRGRRGYAASAAPAAGRAAAGRRTRARRAGSRRRRARRGRGCSTSSSSTPACVSGA